MHDKQKLIKRQILKNILWCLCGAMLFTIVSLNIIFSSDAQDSQGKQWLALFILFDFAIIFVIALISLGALSMVQFISSDKMLSVLAYFLPTLLSSFVLSVIAFKLFEPHDKLIAVPLIPVCSYDVMWIVFYFTIHKKLKMINK